MAEAMELGKDPNGPTHSSTLFVREDGSSMSFYVRPSPAKRRLSTLILHGGGTLCRVQEPGAVLLAQPGEAAAEASGDFISTQYILDCVERNEKLELEAYRLGPAPAAYQAPETKPGVLAGGVAAAEPEPQSQAGRMVFTDADDVAIITYVKEHARSASSVTGNALWKAMEKSSLTQHSWQSMKDRYLKRLRGQEHKYLLGEAPVSPSSQKLKRKAEQDPEAADSGEPQNKRTPDLPEEEFEKEEIKENEAAVKKMLVEATREFEEIVVDESPDFEIHITMCDDDPCTPEEDSETQPDEEEEEEEKVSAPEVGAAIKIIRQLMEKFNLDLSTVTQAFLKNSGELEATSSFLESGQRADGYPIWSRQDDLDLQKDDEATRDALVKKFGAQNVARRIEFRKK
ncbi:telomeric repeat-binding factor 2-interacting protein 1 [Bos indicus]|uniref:Telomeric repeat-binding factor 2-interacting protein 1 n=5 Tax=Bovinae TaxID=27592 RepID=TE2IP_BOVIN|nr:telomeric repeat-binding factor 2-interacting protein 1 [Bos taurus]XP_010849073.1 PREDICTED: telomeric repeat-binding factor 2-interacting protein 1 [Bison bison bison]XP_061242769.1 telomeric repeat-binding factor 2-interacting protein 1 [Bos javanicus]Q0VCT3.1 RecName: Full=Telomeric repeat-binding factor 2-interacting protein 1; Short=TERF2-interacting telomeric protein 1; Short=TRF2-interacting telomeric protein 1; AltName: Full=Repressor/activator protein 1 homolog; Short=RAP1 homolog [